MSVQFGRWSFDNQPPSPDFIGKVSASLAVYGPDSDEVYSIPGVNILYRAFHTTRESHHEIQPHISPSGTVTTWDGRLDNRTDLIWEIHEDLRTSSPDVDIVAAAYEKWDTRCLSKLIGDWALSIWNPRTRSLVLAKDPIGTRHLYYSIDNREITWSTILDPLVLFAEKSFAICEEYIAGWFSHFPAAHLTPYAGIQAVPPSSFVTLRAGQHAVRTHWDFDPENRIRYRTDGEYEEHFRAVFASAVRRRLRADRPVLAELSGGVDSSCIVCIADALIACTGAEGVRLDTISYYDDNEPNWGEKGNFVKVEEMRGRAGCHIAVNLEKDIASDAPVGSHFGSDHFVAIPIATPRHRELLTRYAAHMKSEGHRVVLSGIGAEVPTGGGVPTPTPELQDLLSQGRFLTLARQLNGWARKMRRSRALLLWEAIRGFVPGIDSTGIRSAPWLHADFVRRNHRALCGYPRRVQILGARPSFQDHLTGLDFLRRLVAYRSLRPQLPSDVRLPFLDLDFLKFMYAIPREQIVRMGERRSLMKRALSGIVPPEVLNRKKRAFVQEASSRNTSSDRPCFVGMDNHPLLSSCIGMIDANRLREALRRAGNDQEVSLERLERTLTFEFWLRHLAIHNVALDLASVGKPNHGSSRKPTYLRSDAVSKRSAS